MKQQKVDDTNTFLSQDWLDQYLKTDEPQGLRSENELDFLFRQMYKFPPMNREQEKSLTTRIFEGKAEILTRLAIAELIFPYYLDIMIDTSVDTGDESESDKQEKDRKVKPPPRFEQYLNGEDMAEGSLMDFEEFKKVILELKRKCLRAQRVMEKDTLDHLIKQRKDIFNLLKKINFSWTRLQKDGLFILIPKNDPAYLKFHADVTEMCNHNMRLSMSVARKYFLTNSHHSDLFQEASLGLLTAIDRFDPGRGFKFSTYAIRWLKHRTNRFVSQFRTIRVPVHFADKISALKSLERWHPEWDNERLAKEMGFPLEDIEDLQQVSRQTNVGSLDEPVRKDPSGDGEDTMGMFIADPSDNAEQIVLEFNTSEEILRAMKARLNAREYEIMIRRLGLDNREEETLEEIGIYFKLSRERIRQIEAVAIKKLRRTKFFKQLHAFTKNNNPA